MIYFTKGYLQFFKELAANNNKKWFDENRKRYESTVREPFKLFVKDVIAEVQKIDSSLQLEPKDAIFRINRDIRFSKDKTPYKLFNSAIISKTGRKDKSFPGMYLELNPERLAIFGGIYNPDKEQVNKIRNHIVTNIISFEKLLESPDFLKSYGSIEGNKNKRIPKELQEMAERQPLLYNKQWYYQSYFLPKLILQDNLLETIIEQYKIARPLQIFLTEALK